MARLIRDLALLSVGGAIAALADPVSGARRRHTLRDRAMASARRPMRLARGRGRRTLRYMAGQARGKLHDAVPTQHAPDDDRTLADKVRSEAFRDVSVTPHEVNVGVVDGIVTLRGELHSRSAIEGLVDRVHAVPGVHGVECLVHLPGEPAPHNGRA
jgi:osmotically-inducible protein OsmY